MISPQLRLVQSVDDIDFDDAPRDGDGDAYVYVRGLHDDECPACIGGRCAQKVVRLRRHLFGDFACLVVHEPHSLN